MPPEIKRRKLWLFLSFNLPAIASYCQLNSIGNQLAMENGKRHLKKLLPHNTQERKKRMKKGYVRK